jgi:imidazole glycerol-phosphate synthase subunit HisF
MLKRRIVPKLLLRSRALGQSRRPILVTTRGFRDEFEVGDPVSQAKIYEAQLADELAILNIEGRPIAGAGELLAVIERLASETFMPLLVGGGVRSLDDFALLLERGADKVAINSAALADPALVSRAAERFGAQCVVVSIDYRRDAAGRLRVYGARASSDSGRDPVDWAREVVEAGAGELLLTDADRDGGGGGLDLATGDAVSRAVDVPVILSGGCGLATHFVEGFRTAGAEAVAAGTFFNFRDQNPMQARAHVRSAGIPIREQT